MRTVRITAFVPRSGEVDKSRVIQNCYFTKRITYDQWTPEMTRIGRQGGRILKVEMMGGT
ncbi:MAG: photosystem I reaction center subunit XII [Gemmatimonadaceae bacterium]|nr:photosystem I reaction center subunit XII [Gloeobacterales cyanobacterium ES-bin-141]